MEDFDFINEWDEYDDPDEFDEDDDWLDPAFTSERNVNGMFFNNYL